MRSFLHSRYLTGRYVCLRHDVLFLFSGYQPDNHRTCARTVLSINGSHILLVDLVNDVNALRMVVLVANRSAVHQ